MATGWKAKRDELLAVKQAMLSEKRKRVAIALGQTEFRQLLYRRAELLVQVAEIDERMRVCRGNATGEYVDVVTIELEVALLKCARNVADVETSRLRAHNAIVKSVRDLNLTNDKL